MSGKQGKTQREGSEEEGLNSLPIYPLACISAHKKSRKKKEVMEDGTPESHSGFNSSGPSLHVFPGSQRSTQAGWRGQPPLLPTYCFWDGKNRPRGLVLPGITFQEDSSSDIKGKMNTIKDR